jgi:hypothetical protein
MSFSQPSYVSATTARRSEKLSGSCQDRPDTFPQSAMSIRAAPHRRREPLKVSPAVTKCQEDMRWYLK